MQGFSLIKHQRNRDIETLEALLSDLPEVVMQEHFQVARRGYVTDEILYFWEGFDARMDPDLFHMHNVSVADAIREFYSNWNTFHSEVCLWTGPANNGYAISREGMSRQEFDRCRERTQRLADSVQQSYKSMVRTIKCEYPEVNYREAYQRGWGAYVSTMQDPSEWPLQEEWKGIDFESSFFAWEGPFRSLEEEDPRVMQPYGKQIRFNEALKNAGHRPSYTNDPLGLLVVYETDRKSWLRRVLGGGKKERQTLVVDAPS